MLACLEKILFILRDFHEYSELSVADSSQQYITNYNDILHLLGFVFTNLLKTAEYTNNQRSKALFIHIKYK